MNQAPQMILMRGLPSCGKSWSARKIAATQSGTLLEYDTYFEENSVAQEIDAAARRRHPQARRWHLDRVRQAIDSESPLIVVDDDHTFGASAKALVGYAVLHGYEVSLAEPESPWWQEVQALLEDKHGNGEALARWATKLSLLSRSGHPVTTDHLLRCMEAWQPEVTPAELLTWGAELVESSPEEGRSDS